METMPTSTDTISSTSAEGSSDVTFGLDVNSMSEYPIRAGGFGDIYVGQMKDSTKVAVKCARHKPQDHGDGKDLKRVAREIHAWSKCDHKNVLALFGLAQHRGRLAIISPWMENGTLPEYVAKRPEVDRLDLCLQITEGLEYLHKGDMIHGDLKGYNILVSEDGVPKLADFGNTKLGQQSARFTTGTDTTGTGVMCTLRWAAPEIMRNSSRSTQADVYALGMTILETVTGAVPYEDKADLAVLVEVLVQQRFPLRHDDSMRIRGDKNRLWDLMTKCWNHDGTYRPEAPQIKEELASILASASFIEVCSSIQNPTFHSPYSITGQSFCSLFRAKNSASFNSVADNTVVTFDKSPAVGCQECKNTS
ncbi:hypothetical protein FRC08_006441 [Ceratobasidium sp. 394]|nr:hypothetical protein FRC08_006441 [Ceratobasidium sp. 394]